MVAGLTLQGAAKRLSRAGFVAAADEAQQLAACAGGDPAALEALVARRLTGEPLAWITGRTVFFGLTILIHSGVYVPRPHTERLARRAIERCPAGGIAVDLCTGSGAVARALMAGRPRARVLAVDADGRAVECARANGVEAYQGDLYAPLPPDVAGRVDLVTAVVPYVPTGELRLLQRDTFAFESPLAYSGGEDGTTVLRRAVTEGGAFLRPRGAMLLELGGGQAEAMTRQLERAGYRDVRMLADEDGDLRGVEATLSASAPAGHRRPAASGRRRG